MSSFYPNGDGNAVTGINSLNTSGIVNFDAGLGGSILIVEKFSHRCNRGWSRNTMWRDSNCTYRVSSLAKAQEKSEDKNGDATTA